MPRTQPAAVALASLTLLVTATGVAVAARQHHDAARVQPSAGAPLLHPGRSGAAAGAAAQVVARPGSATLRADRAAPQPVRPLRALTQPDLVVRSDRRLAAAAVRRLAASTGVAALAVVDIGRVRTGGQRLQVLGADPSELRGFTPALTARSDALWRLVASGDVAASFAVRVGALRHRLGDALRLRSHGRQVLVRLGAFAALGLGRAQGVVDHATARLLGLHPRREVLVSAPRLTVDAALGAVRAVLGPHVHIHVARPQIMSSAVGAYARSTIPASYLALYRSAALTCPGLPWTVLAGIGAAETGHGADTSRSPKGALGPMQFLPSTFAAVAVDGDGDGRADIMDPADAIFSAARYLCLTGGGRGGQSLADAIWSYNHARWYVREVLHYAAAYAS